ncbi:MAG: nucleoside hydrolase [Acidobacteriota bacterium]
MPFHRFSLFPLFLLAALLSSLLAAERRKIIIDQDCRGPATTDLQSVLLLVQSPSTEVLGITVVSGDQWRDEEVAHTLRLLEIIGRTDIPVVPGAVFPLINNEEEIHRWEKLYGRVGYKGAWNQEPRTEYEGEWAKRRYHPPFFVPPLPEGDPTTQPAAEDAPHFLIRMVRRHPHEVTLYAGGPLTNLALAITLDPHFAELAQELVLMGGSINPRGKESEFADANRREFNFWWDPEAAHIVLRSAWPKVTVTTVDLSIQTRLRKEMIAEIEKSGTPLARYLARWADEEYMWDEVAAAAWLDPSLIRKERSVFMDIDISHGPGYGNTLTWKSGDNPGLGEQEVHVQLELDLERFYQLFVDLMSAPTPEAKR